MKAKTKETTKREIKTRHRKVVEEMIVYIIGKENKGLTEDEIRGALIREFGLVMT